MRRIMCGCKFASITSACFMPPRLSWNNNSVKSSQDVIFLDTNLLFSNNSACIYFQSLQRNFGLSPKSFKTCWLKTSYAWTTLKPHQSNNYEIPGVYYINEIFSYIVQVQDLCTCRLSSPSRSWLENLSVNVIESRCFTACSCLSPLHLAPETVVGVDDGAHSHHG